MNFGKLSRNGSLPALIVLAISSTANVGAQQKAGNQASQKAPLRQFIVLMKPGPKWIAGKPASEQPLQKHGRYLKELMEKGSLQFAGQFLDNSGGLSLLNAADEAEARQIVAHDPGVADGVLQPEIRPFLMAFDSTTGKSPFN